MIIMGDLLNFLNVVRKYDKAVGLKKKVIKPVVRLYKYFTKKAIMRDILIGGITKETLYNFVSIVINTFDRNRMDRVDNLIRNSSPDSYFSIRYGVIGDSNKVVGIYGITGKDLSISISVSNNAINKGIVAKYRVVIDKIENSFEFEFKDSLISSEGINPEGRFKYIIESTYNLYHLGIETYVDTLLEDIIKFGVRY